MIYQASFPLKTASFPLKTGKGGNFNGNTGCTNYFTTYYSEEF